MFRVNKLRNDGGAWARIFDFGTGNTNYVFFTLYINANNATRYTMCKSSIGEQVISTNKLLNINQWYNISVVGLGDNVSFYVDNNFFYGSTIVGIAKMQDLGITDKNYLGKSQYAEDKYFYGYYSNFIIIKN
jgi:hypothetical protein